MNHDPFTIHYKSMYTGEWFHTHGIRWPFDIALLEIVDMLRRDNVPFYVEYH